MESDCRTWVTERKAKEDEVYHANHAEYLAGRLSVAPPVPSNLADFDEHSGMIAGANADKKGRAYRRACAAGRVGREDDPDMVALHRSAESGGATGAHA